MIEVPISPVYPRGHWEAAYLEIREGLFESMPAAAADRAAALFEGFLANPALSGFRPTLVHGRLIEGSVLWDPESRELTGILDFDHAGMGDPAVDIAAVSRFGADFAERLARSYPEVTEMGARTAFYAAAAPLQRALEALRGGDPEAVHRALSEFSEGVEAWG
jgi:aminoglycoside 2''-phosphotransferase